MKKVLRTAALALSAFFATTVVHAQLPDGSVAPNFTITDLDGNTHELYDYLDQGYTVILDLYAVWCGPCWNYHNTGTGHPNAGALKSLYNQYGPDGTGEVMVFAIESDASTPANTIYGGGNSIGDWTVGVPYPMANDDNIADLYNLAYYPTIYTICPNRIVNESGQVSVAAHYADAQACPVASEPTDAALLTYNGDTQICGGGEAELVVTLQNNGLEPLTSATIEVTGDATLSYNWSGNLATYQMTEVVVGTVSGSDALNLTISVVASNDASASNNAVSAAISTALESTTHIRVNIQTDNWPIEVEWDILNEMGNSVASGGPYGTNPNGENPVTVSEDHWVPSTGCYTFRMTDGYGDGMNGTQWGGVDGSYLITSIDDNNGVFSVIATYDGSYGYEEETAGFESSVVVSLDEVTELVEDFVVFPNPTNAVSTISYTLGNTSDVSITVYNTLGEVVVSEDLGTRSAGLNLFELNLGGMDAGLYFVNLVANDRVVTKKVTLTK